MIRFFVLPLQYGRVNRKKTEKQETGRGKEIKLNLELIWEQLLH
jgi:hypothetical protein